MEETLTAKDFPVLSGLNPATPFWAVGDVHGRDDLLGPLLERLLQDDLPVVILGDVINRGPQSAAVLRRLYGLASDPRIIVLRGNHELLLRAFLYRPRRNGRVFLQYGGRATLESFGVTDLPAEPAAPDFGAARDQLLQAMGPLATWLGKLPFHWQSGNVAALHAGADPLLPLDQQPPQGFAWGHPNFTRFPRTDGQWIVHGHSPVDDIEIAERRIAINTCADQTGLLTAVRLETDAVTLLAPGGGQDDPDGPQGNP